MALPAIVVALGGVLLKAGINHGPQIIQNILNKDPVLKNTLNAEKPWQSRVAVGNLAAAVGVLVMMASKYAGWPGEGIGEDIVQTLSALEILWGIGYSFYGRFRSGLKPLFSHDG